MSGSHFDPDQFTRAGCITRKYYRDVYPTIDPSRPELSQKDKVTIVTGAGKGIGRAIARAHAQSGVKGLVLVTQSAQSAEETKAVLKAEFPSVDVLSLPTDITNEKEIAQTFDTIRNHFGIAHTLINNAGVFASIAPVAQSDSNTWWKDFEVNVRGTYLVTAAYLRLIAAESADFRPTVVNLISTIGLTPPGLSSYFISKLAVAKFTEFVTAENPQVATYSLSPGIVQTSMTLDSFKPFAKDTAELPGAVTVYLAAKRPQYLNGRHLSSNWDLAEIEDRETELFSSDTLKVGQFI
ncbi:SDR family oxidoreductase [Aspergillus vadensis CBS 113365]|uniref:NAD(P)-binding protein n=1 Tax=Aspergillus vadensis (strain CBS 113365 / IMI 142717 / IBT 24658) TaxID=1448311 RepID=A0A319B2L0_ASPVC|nr:NAD(P)-binding protein [Aspergillus vadensis CBS 113365]PYH65991.1 NAD(P)-binding protein [Aspergillus vadensis CBS 113365]